MGSPSTILWMIWRRIGPHMSVLAADAGRCGYLAHSLSRLTSASDIVTVLVWTSGDPACRPGGAAPVPHPGCRPAVDGPATRLVDRATTAAAPFRAPISPAG